MGLIDKVQTPQDLKRLSYDQLHAYAEEVRDFIIQSIQLTGGHLSSNLGTVELSIALHYVFSSPEDKLLWDVGHQAYTHKIITGRKDSFVHLRENGGISGFPKQTESVHDSFTMGHSSTSLSVGLGYAKARDLAGQENHVVSIIGDGALTGGMAFEALNDIGASHTKMIIILNDNKMSINANVGAFSKHLSRLRLSKRYARVKHVVKKGVIGLPFFGNRLFKILEKGKNITKMIVHSNKIFETLGLKYFGPIDGHDLIQLIEVLEQLKNEKGPILLHLVTSKGRGYEDAEINPTKFHGVSPCAGVKEKSYSELLGSFLCHTAKEDKKVFAITAAMADGTGLENFSKQFPKQFSDVGIAEQHAVTLAAGLAAGGINPFVAIYSTFLQRSFDQILHDVCIGNLPVTFCIDRAGAVGADGVTHQGIYDISYLNFLPNMTICAPKDGGELLQILNFALTYNKPLAVRYPKSYSNEYNTNFPIVPGKWEKLKSSSFRFKNDGAIYIFATGNRAIDVAMQVEQATVVNSLFIKPLDYEMIKEYATKSNLVITMEDNALQGGFGAAVLNYCNDKQFNCNIRCIGYEDSFLENYCVSDSLRECGMTKDNILDLIKNFEQTLQ